MSRHPHTAADALISWPAMLMVGGAGRNSGKTRLTCALIRRFAARGEVVGVKVTTVQERDGGCPRGGDGCGVCSSVTGRYLLTEEHGKPPGKDTSLMAQSGATRVYWLRVLREHLAAGAAALANRLGTGALCVCESNSLRHVVEPGLLVIVRARGARAIKRSSREVMHLAHRVVVYDESGPDVPLDAFDFDVARGRWTLTGAEPGAAGPHERAGGNAG